MKILVQRQQTAGDLEGGGIMEELAQLVAEAILLGVGAPALAPGPAEGNAVAGTPSVEVCPVPSMLQLQLLRMRQPADAPSSTLSSTRCDLYNHTTCHAMPACA